MTARSRRLRVVPPAPAAADPGPARPLDGVALSLVAVGLLPLVGYALLGGWSEREMGAGLAIAALAALLDGGPPPGRSGVTRAAAVVHAPPTASPRDFHQGIPAFSTICRR